MKFRLRRKRNVQNHPIRPDSWVYGIILLFVFIALFQLYISIQQVIALGDLHGVHSPRTSLFYTVIAPAVYQFFQEPDELN